MDENTQTSKEKFVRVQTYLTQEERKKFRVKLTQEGIPMSTWIKNLILEYIKE